MKNKGLLFTLSLLLSFTVTQAQTTKSKEVVDSLIDYDALFSELDLFFDSLYTPKSFAIINIGASNGFYNYRTNSGTSLTARKRLLINPSIGYFHKDGAGINVSGSMIKEETNINLYQVAATVSYDYLKNRKFSTGISLTHFFTKDSLPFYTSPLQNEGYAYFTVRKWWIKPSVAASYGWGSRTNYEERKEYITKLRLRPSGYTTVSSKESIADFTMTASIKHDFYWLNTFFKRDYFRITPLISFTSGTQKFGFNQTSDTYTTSKGKNKNPLYNSENISLNSNEKFGPLNLTGMIKTEYSFGKFFLQPQWIVDYYFPSNNKKIAMAFALNAGFIL